jgi:beta-lactamase class A
MLISIVVSKNSLIILSFGLTLSLLGFILGRISVVGQKSTISETRNKENYKFINPLLECESTEFSKTAALEPLRKKLDIAIEEQKKLGNINYASIYVRDLNDGPWLGINEKDNFSPASLVKVPLMMAYFKAAEKKPELLNETITTESSTSSSQSILPEITLVPKQAYTIDELINRMIIYSDNQAYELLQNYIDNKLIVKTYTDLGIDLTDAYSDPNGNILSVKYYASFFRILFNASYLNKDMSEKALHLLSQVKYKNGLVKGVNNPSIEIAHKFGERTYEANGEKQLHDCGIIYIPNKPHLVCIMTRGTDFSKLSTTIIEITKIIYKELL